MSSIGKPDRQLWYEHNLPQDQKEPFRAENYMKFLYGHVLEEIVLYLVELAGHRVEGRQDVQDIEGVKGHRDCVIDGMLIDVKTASPFSFKRFEEGKLAENDAFGYIKQINSYLESGQEDPLITEKDKAGFLVVDKSLGKFALDIHEKDQQDYHELYRQKKEMIKQEEVPERCYPTVPDGYKNYKTGEFVENGNQKLGMNCSYCPWKKICYPEMRTFLSSKGPVYFAHVEKEPKMHEVT